MKNILILFIIISSISLFPQNRWEKLNGPVGGTFFAIEAKGDTIIAGTGNFKGLFFYSFDGGNKWNQSNIKLNGRITSFIMSDDYIIAVAGPNGAYMTDIPDNYYSDFSNEVSVVVSGQDPGNINGEQEREISYENNLLQNYPNPFNPTTRITFSMAEEADATIILYNLLGQEVIPILNKRLPSGSHSIEFNAGSLPSGLYFYKLTAGKYTDTKKLILLK
jgi:hypothetical protein